MQSDPGNGRLLELTAWKPMKSGCWFQGRVPACTLLRLGLESTTKLPVATSKSGCCNITSASPRSRSHSFKLCHDPNDASRGTSTANDARQKPNPNEASRGTSTVNGASRQTPDPNDASRGTSTANDAHQKPNPNETSRGTCTANDASRQTPDPNATSRGTSTRCVYLS